MISPKVSCRSRVWVIAGMAALACVVLPAARALLVQQTRVPLSVDAAAEGLVEPMGLAVDPRNGDLFIAERGADRISRLSDSVVGAFIARDFSVVPDRVAPAQAATTSRLQAPRSIAMDDQGFLYAVDGAGAERILRFSRVEDGVVSAVALATPLDGHGQTYSSVTLDGARRLYVTAQQRVAGDTSGYGAVLMRHPDGAWWMVDYSPLARFSNVATDPQGKIMVVGERLKGDAVWYHTERHWEMGAMEGLQGLRHVAVLADGTSLAASLCGDGTWCLVEMDPVRGVTREWLSGLSEIGGLAADWKDPSVYVSLPREGRVLRVTRSETEGLSRSPLRDLEIAFQSRHLMAPKAWPEFFRSFIDKLGVVKAVDSETAPGASTALTVSQFTEAMPVVAGKFKARLLSPPEQEADPIQEISFLILYPNKMSNGSHHAQPGVSLMRAVHRSGAVRKTNFLGGGLGAGLSGKSGGNLLSFPSGFFVPPSELSEEGHCRVYFLGMGMGPDYWMDVHLVDRTRSVLVVEKTSKQRIEYALEACDEGSAVLVANSSGPADRWLALGRGISVSQALTGSRGVNCRHASTLGGALAASEPRAEAVPAAAPSWRQEVLVRAASRWSETFF